ncbi:phosphoadenosine phosphosulfate reductase-like protein [Leishmania infantum JPCM5]|uniref:FAD synthase n=4 Tax=Leishmania donovani species complex TaxID=38574 RepID=A0A6L0XMD1_LEIIN|nr:phosphoadenosine phosphosulfate reductase-like protein [Leishmania infantum JPCM5]XP_003862140.1 phosphoadenosine phosphosulfate reductase-like protein [Leishmania donovani]CAC9501821.1 phosphoadenosine_phosphosulfate_reductase-like_protein [Leishmania infantum]AYU80180.1 phosphoadenosine phosphosulfate reductase-like protein [Leishmania donovani]CAM69265.1 phosphoadenosine phosphosulfate reductase-like protein [Leishmania infantum JPCM5]CBZ35446.1 phosphoadenosine phosphosulfate reductase-|eukprot:XP_001470073.1 phosphoadenosine phosphosulfate reductase-like protein [Leishmania infantum JPCM5]
MSPQLMDRVNASEYLIRDIFKRYAPSEIGVAFNGGKDSVVMFELLRSAVTAPVLAQCCIFVVEHNDEFDELRKFRAWYMQEVARGLPLVHQGASQDMRLSLWTLTEKHPLKVVFMGTRKTDPHGRYQKEAVEKTTPGWPDFLRACPLFHWSVNDVWAYTRLMCIPQCSLYESGYSSVGRSADTNRNPLLRRDDGSYRPAWELTCDNAEREGRQTE